MLKTYQDSVVAMMTSLDQKSMRLSHFQFSELDL